MKYLSGEMFVFPKNYKIVAFERAVKKNPKEPDYDLYVNIDEKTKFKIGALWKNEKKEE